MVCVCFSYKKTVLFSSRQYTKHLNFVPFQKKKIKYLPLSFHKSKSEKVNRYPLVLSLNFLESLYIHIYIQGNNQLISLKVPQKRENENVSPFNLSFLTFSHLIATAFFSKSERRKKTTKHDWNLELMVQQIQQKISVLYFSF